MIFSQNVKIKNCKMITFGTKSYDAIGDSTPENPFN